LIPAGAKSILMANWSIDLKWIEKVDWTTKTDEEARS